MEKQTIQEIIKIIDAACNNLDKNLNEETTNADKEYLIGGMHQLSALSQHLQNLIQQN